MGRGVASSFGPATVPTDNKGNAFKLLGVHDYSPNYPNSGEALYAVAQAVGGAGHIFSTRLTISDEVTFSVIEVKNGGLVQDAKWNKASTGASNTSATVTTTGPATLVAIWAGDGAAARMTAVPDNGFTVVESQLVNTTCAVQAVVATKHVPAAGTFDVSWSVTPPQGANLWLAAVQ